MRRILALLGSIALLLPAACRTLPPPPEVPTATPAARTLRLGLADTAAPLQPLLTDAYAVATDRTRLEFAPGNDAALLADVAGGQLDAAFVHEIPPGTALWYAPVALDGVVVLLHPDNPLDSLSQADLQGLFSGRIASWSALGGEDRPVVPIVGETGTGARAIFARRVLGAQRVTINALVAPTYAALLESVAAEPGAVAYGMMGYALGVKVAALGGSSATPASTATQTYPLTAPLYVAAREEPAGPAGAELRAFIAWLQSSDGQALIGDRYGRVR